MEYSTGQAAQKSGIAIHTLRYYDDIGLTPFIGRNQLGYRKYTDTDLEWIYMIKCLRDIDMPIRSIKEYIELLAKGDTTAAKRREIMQQYQTFVDSRMESLKVIQHLIAKKMEYYNSLSIASISCTDYQDEWEQLKAGTK